MERYKQLVEKINFHNHRYYVLESPEIADAEYDQLMQELRHIEADHPELQSPDSPTQRVGAGPSGLAAAIRLKQLNADLGIVVVEKGSEVGAHILSGAVIDPKALNELLPDWKEQGAPLETPVARDVFLALGSSGDFEIPMFPMPRFMHNHGNYIASLANLCRWLATRRARVAWHACPGAAPSSRPQAR